MALLFLLLVAPQARAAETLVEEVVFDLTMLGQSLGRLRSEELILEERGEQLQATRMRTEFSINRMDQPMKMSLRAFQVYDAQGRLVRFESDMKMSGTTRTTRGWIDGSVCRVETVDPLTGRKRQRELPYDPEAVSEKEMEDRFELLARGAEGESVNATVFMPDLLRSVSTTATLVSREPRQTHFGKMELSKIRVTMNLGVPLVNHLWVDAEGEVFENEINLGPLKLRAIRVSGDAPKTAAAAEPPADLFKATILSVERPIPRPSQVRRAIFRLRFNSDASPRGFYEDEGQKALGMAEGGTLRLEVVSRRPKRPVAISNLTTPPGAEDCLASSSFVQSDDPEVQAAAHKAAAGETEAWKLAKRLESWVYDHVEEKNLGVGFASAKETLRSREGDCTEHAVLLTALCRANGIPARGADGLVYAKSLGGFGYHMWTEAYIGDAWHDLDATRPGAEIDAARIQLGADALDDLAYMDLSLKILRFFGAFEIEVESVEY